MSILNKMKSAGFGQVTTTQTNVAFRPCSPAQITWYTQLCAKKLVEPVEGHEHYSMQDMKVEIDRVNSIPVFIKASDNQLLFITEMLNDLEITVPELGHLSMTSAKEMIENLKKAHDLRMQFKPSKKQMELLTQMLACPDCNEAELIGVPEQLINDYFHSQEELKALYAVQNNYQSEIQHNVDTLKGDELKSAQAPLRTKLAKLESDIESTIFMQLALGKKIESFEDDFDIKNLTKQVVSEFISKYQQAYREWLRDRASEAQRNMINSMLVKNGQHELEATALIQFSKAQASTMIEMLNAGKVPEYIYTGIRSFEVEHDGYSEKVDTRENCLFSVGAMANFSPDDIRSILNQPEEQQFQSISELVLIASALNGKATVVDMLEKGFEKVEIATFFM